MGLGYGVREQCQPPIIPRSGGSDGDDSRNEDAWSSLEGD